MAQLGTLRGSHYRKADGAQAEGDVLIELQVTPPTLRDPAGNVIWAGDLTVPLSGGSFQVDLPGVGADPAISPAVFAYKITERLKHVPKAKYRSVIVQLPAGGLVDLADVEGTGVSATPVLAQPVTQLELDDAVQTGITAVTDAYVEAAKPEVEEYVAGRAVVLDSPLRASIGIAVGLEVPDAVDAYIATDPTVAQNAATLAQSNVGLVRDTSAGVPNGRAGDVKLAGVVQSEVALTYDDRVVEARAKQVNAFGRIDVIGGGSTESRPVRGSAFAVLMNPTGYNGGERKTELDLDVAGNLATWACERIVARGGANSPNASVPIDLWLMLGQSNATPRSSLPAQLLTDTAYVKRWNSGTSTWDTETGVPWLGSGVARAWLSRAARDAGRRVGLVPCAVGSTGFSSTASTSGHWNRGVTGTGPDLATAAITKAQAALAAAPAGSRIVGVIWSQGEQDRGMTTSAYTAALDDLISWTRTQLSLSSLPWILSPQTPILATLSPASGGTAARNADLEDTPRRVANTAFLLDVPDDSEGTAGDGVFGIHWTPEAQHRRGRTMILGLGDLPSAYDVAVLNRADAAARTPQGLKVTRSGDQVTITWQHPTTRVLNFVLETSTNSGSTWATQTLTAPTTHRHTMTVTAATPIWARIAAVCANGTSNTSTEVRA